MQSTSSRDDAIMHMLSTAEWTPVSILVKQAERCDAFRRPDGQPVGQSWKFPRRDVGPGGILSVSAGFSGSLRKVVHRTLKRLVERGEIETTMQPGVRGPVCLARKRFLKVVAGDRN